MSWPCKYNILIEIETQKLPQIFSILSFQKLHFQNVKVKKNLHGWELEPSAFPSSFTEPWYLPYKLVWQLHSVFWRG